MDYIMEYKRWLNRVEDDDIIAELKNMDEAAVEDAFYRDLAFGTGGLRGVLGVGTNRMNKYVVGKASQGLSHYLLERYESPSVVIGYDSRINSDVFAREAAEVFAANCIRVWLWPELTPVPAVSFAVRELNASAGVMITASHNPEKYNGYKVYGPDGCQINTETADQILSHISVVDIFDDVRKTDYYEAVKKRIVRNVPPFIMDHYIEAVKRQSVLFGDEIDKHLSVVYTPLNGTGLKPVMRVLEGAGFSSVTVVREQKNPDGTFPTCPYPNPEIPEAMDLGLAYCRRSGADLLIATDPDADRCGMAVRDGADYRLLSANEAGLLLLDYICSQRVKHGKMPERPVFIKTIVTMDLAEKIAAHYGVETMNVLTGFKYVGEVMGQLEAAGRGQDFIFAFEESCGYLSGTYVRDKDGVNAAFLICEMFAFYQTRGITLIEKLSELYSQYGYCLNVLHSYEFEGSAGMRKMAEIMDGFRRDIKEISGQKVLKTEDYSKGLNGLPKSDVLKFCTSAGTVVVRPSGTEPKLKLYISVTASDASAAEKMENTIHQELEMRIK